MIAARRAPRGFIILGSLLLATLALLLVGALVLGAATLWWAHELPPPDAR